MSYILFLDYNSCHIRAEGIHDNSDAHPSESLFAHTVTKLSMAVLNLCLPQQDLHFCTANMQTSTYFSLNTFFQKYFLRKTNIMILLEWL